MPPSPAEVDTVLADFADPESGRSVVRMEQIKNVAVDDGRVSVTLGLTSHSAPLREDVKADLTTLLKTRLPEVRDVEVELVEHVRPAEKLGQVGLTAKSVVAVGSGKGGVGKSTIAASLAFGLKGFGCKVGLMDADVYGPSIPHLLGVADAERPEIRDKQIVPIDADGLKVISMGFLVEKDQAVIWRGPMLHGAVTQFLRDTAWGDLDYLIIDMPPGTGDIALTLSQLLPLTGAVVVCTPQEVALLDAVKAIAMFQKVNIPILGMVENMSYFLCPDNGKRYHIFGAGGARDKAEELEAPFLGEVPINITIRERGDAGATSGNLSDAETSGYFKAIAYQLSRSLAAKAKSAPQQPSLPVL